MAYEAISSLATGPLYLKVGRKRSAIWLLVPWFQAAIPGVAILRRTGRTEGGNMTRITAANFRHFDPADPATEPYSGLEAVIKVAND